MTRLTPTRRSFSGDERMARAKHVITRTINLMKDKRNRTVLPKFLQTLNSKTDRLDNNGWNPEIRLLTIIAAAARRSTAADAPRDLSAAERAPAPFQGCWLTPPR